MSSTNVSVSAESLFSASWLQQALQQFCGRGGMASLHEAGAASSGQNQVCDKARAVAGSKLSAGHAQVFSGAL